jgi:hypothetical protein
VHYPKAVNVDSAMEQSSRVRAVDMLYVVRCMHGRPKFYDETWVAETSEKYKFSSLECRQSINRLYVEEARL